MSSLSPEQVKIIKATAPALQEHGKEITTRFYRDLLNEIPDLNNGNTTSYKPFEGLLIVRLTQFSIIPIKSTGIKLLHLQTVCTRTQHTSTT